MDAGTRSGGMRRFGPSESVQDELVKSRNDAFHEAAIPGLRRFHLDHSGNAGRHAGVPGRGLSGGLTEPVVAGAKAGCERNPS